MSALTVTCSKTPTAVTLNLCFVEFVLHPQDEMSVDSGIQIIKDFNYFKNKLRKRPRSLSMVSFISSDWEEYWNTKVIPQNELKSKRMKLEQTND